MSIDRINTGPTAPPSPPGATEPGGVTGRSSAPFQVERAQGPEPVAPTGPLQSLREGAIDPAGYVEAHITQATEHLTMLSPEQKENVRSMLRDACQSDTVLVDLIERATKV